MSTSQLPLRKEISEEFTWNLAPMYTDSSLWEQDFSHLLEELAKMEKYQGHLGDSSSALLQALEHRDKLYRTTEKIFTYAHLSSDVDTQNAEFQGMLMRAQGLFAQLQAVFSFFTPELLTIPQTKIKEFFQQEEGLEVYTHEFEELEKLRAHILSSREEEILAKASESMNMSEQTFGMLNNADLSFPAIQDESGQMVTLSHGLYGKLLESQDRRVRKDAFEGMYSSYDKVKNTMASTLSGTVKSHNAVADIRGFSSARQAALADNFIAESVYDTLVDTVGEYLPLLHRYIDLRKSVLKLDELRMYDLYVPMVDHIEMSFTYEAAQDLVLKALAVLGEEYQEILRKAFSERWIDVQENQGKRSGAYSSGCYDSNPYILLNWQDTLDNVYTLAHELGHSVHSYYTRSTQPYVYGSYSIFLAEIASTTNENLLTEYLLQQYPDPAMQAYIINHYLDGVKGTVFRQTQFAEFEQAIHLADQSGTPLTADYLTQEYFKLNEKYYGTQMSYDSLIGLEWSRIPHFYLDFYVYQYATGFSAASEFSQRILSNGTTAIPAYLNYLKSGSSDYPLDVLKKAGVDMSSKKPIVDTMYKFEQRLQQLQALLLG